MGAWGGFTRLLFRLHWLVGISAGLVLCVVGATGAVLAVQAPVIDALNPAHRLAPGTASTTPSRWIELAEAANAGWIAQAVSWRGEARAVEIRLNLPGQRGHGRQVAVDPYAGVLLGEPRGSAFFAGTQRLHRELVAGAAGKQVVGASTAALLVLLVSGLVLRWPARSSLRTWLRPQLGVPGRARWWSLHSVLATWMLPVYLLIALTGLTWTYPAYRAWIAETVGAPATPRPAPGAVPAPPRVDPAALERALATLRREVPATTRALLALPTAADAPLEWRYLAPGAPHDRAFSRLRLEPDGRVAEHQRWSEMPRGQRLVGALLPLHTGGWFGTAGQVVHGVASFALPLFALTGLWMWRLRRKAARIAVPRREPLPGAAVAQPTT